VLVGPVVRHFAVPTFVAVRQGRQCQGRHCQGQSVDFMRLTLVFLSFSVQGPWNDGCRRAAEPPRLPEVVFSVLALV
jgi:hypothetical protein